MTTTTEDPINQESEYDPDVQTEGPDADTFLNDEEVGAKNPTDSDEAELDDLRPVVERDNGLCQVCGGNVYQVHHIKYRSQGGKDIKSNLVCLCVKHHRQVHDEEIEIVEFDPDNEQMTVVDKETGELIAPLWFYDRPERDADEAHRAYRHISQLRDEESKSRLMLGSFLARVEDGELYESLDHDTFESFLADPEVDMGRTTAYRYMRVYRRLYLQGEVPAEDIVEMGMRKADMISQFYEDDDLPEWVEKAKALSRSDLKEEIHGPNAEDDENGAESDEEDEDDGEPGYVTSLRNMVQELREDPENEDTLDRIIRKCENVKRELRNK